MSHLRKALLYAGLEKQEYVELMPEARAENARHLTIYSSITAAIFALCLLLSALAGGPLAVNQPVYAALLIINLAIFACASALARRRPEHSTLLAISYIVSLYAYSFSISLLHGSLPGTSAVAIPLVMPALFYYRPLAMIGLTVAGVGIYCALSFALKSVSVATLDLWNSVFFGGVAVMLSLFQMRVKFRLLLQNRRNRQLSQNDLLTGAKNRNCFETRKDGYDAACRESLCCVFIDANGLHELNDSQGHEAGDVMLQTVARAAIDRFGAEDTYRIGGDEFVAFCVDQPVDTVRESIREIERRAEAAGYSVSVGASRHDKAELDVALLVKQAEEYMYKEKRKYYEQSGRDRRRRVMGN